MEQLKNIKVQRTITIIVLVIICCGAVLLYKFNPSKVNIFPPCLFKKITGFYCPGCGSTRAIHALLNLNIWQAFRYNMLMVTLLPYMVYEMTAIILKILFNKEIPRIPMNGKVIYALLITIILYWLFRNINLYPFKILAPTEIIV
ncbi:hypothetical protein Clocel_3891 [Clostridium cellulovorans 743B]|uniref:DUF2752 domain-containing protein n=1 Tax=Clostridium cellulovorans (strain ATCC 35296 / DSM 3052 / OCM 3 / 743B) TaxID=573061 RepID=D9SKY5_CLOC7|nr:hypothetical protein Clocel_3891 [Clostridium cellulovorans 743B]